MTNHQDGRRLRALRDVLTRAACACRVLVDLICVMIVVLIAHHTVGAVLVAILFIFSVTGDVLFTHPVGDSELR